MALLTTAVSAVKWSSVSQFGRQIVQLVTTAILARTLLPSDFGLMGMAMVVIGFLNVFRDMGTSSALIQRKDISNNLLSSVFWLNIGFGCLVSLVVYFLAPLLADFYSEQRLVPMLEVLSVSFLISSMSISHQAVLERNMEFSKLAKVEIIATSAGAITGIVLALLGLGVWSLVFQAVSTAIVSSVLLTFVFSDWRPRFFFGLQETKMISRFSLNLSGFNIANYFVRNAPYLLIGKYLGAQDLGYYSLAYRLMLYPLQNITAVVSRVMFPLYSKIGDDNARIQRGYLKVTQAIAFITFPMMLGMMAVSRYFVLSIFGEQWLPVSTLVIILAPIGLIQSIDATTGSLYQSKGRTDWMLRWGVFSGVIAVAALVLGLKWGILGVAIGYLVATAIWTYPGLAIPLKLIEMRVKTLMRGLYRPLLCSILMVLAVEFSEFLLQNSLGVHAAFVVLLSLGILAYAVFSVLLNREGITRLLAIVKP